MSTVAVWNYFRAMDPAFIVTFSVFHYYKSRGWNPKCGLKFGVDFVLYSGNAEHFHSKFGVVVQAELASGSEVPLLGGRFSLNFSKVLSSARVISQSVKDLVRVSVVLPSGDASHFEDLAVLNSVKFKECQLKRFKV